MPCFGNESCRNSLNYCIYSKYQEWYDFNDKNISRSTLKYACVCMKMVTAGRILNQWTIIWSAYCKEENGCQLYIVYMGLHWRLVFLF